MPLQEPQEVVEQSEQDDGDREPPGKPVKLLFHLVEPGPDAPHQKCESTDTDGCDDPTLETLDQVLFGFVVVAHEFRPTSLLDGSRPPW